jgi:hypothetical protein
MRINEFIRIAENVKLYYHGNSYKETLNYSFRDNLNRLKRLKHEKDQEKDATKIKFIEKSMIYSINEILYAASILKIESLTGLNKKYEKIIF